MASFGALSDHVPILMVRCFCLVIFFTSLTTAARRSLVECWTSHKRLVSRTNLSRLQQEVLLWHTLLIFHPRSHNPFHAHRPRHARLAIINLWSRVVVFVFAAHLPPLSSSCSAWRQQLWRRNFVNRVFPLTSPFYFSIFFLVSRVAVFLSLLLLLNLCNWVEFSMQGTVNWWEAQKQPGLEHWSNWLLQFLAFEQWFNVRAYIKIAAWIELSDKLCSK